jgi:hypothetical protein
VTSIRTQVLAARREVLNIPAELAGGDSPDRSPQPRATKGGGASAELRPVSALVAGMPKVLAWLSVIGTAAMLWVGGHIVLAGAAELGWSAPYDLVHHLEQFAHGVPGVGGVLGWVVNTLASALLGIIIGTVLVLVIERLPRRRPKDEHGAASAAAH